MATINKYLLNLPVDPHEMPDPIIEPQLIRVNFGIQRTAPQIYRDRDPAVAQGDREVVNAVALVIF